jgi:phenylacetate-CoA ligase
MAEASTPPAGRTLDVAPELRDPEALRAHQRAELNRVLARAGETPFYRERFAGLPAAVASLDELAAFPTTAKQDVLADLARHPPYGSRARASRAEIRHVVTTSGTSGAGEEVYPMDAEDEERVHRMVARGFSWAGVDAGSVVVNTLPMTTAAAGQWYYHALRLLGATVLEVGMYPTGRKVEYLRRFGGDTLVGTPAYLLHMAAVAEEAGTDPARAGVRRLVVAGESWSEAWMRRLEERWSARVFEQYGSTQRAMAWSCERGALPGGERGVLHALSDHGVYEVVDPATGAPVDEGPGELVVTPFVSSASPLVRFATGDRVVVTASCPCGRPGPCLVAGRADRYDFMVKVRGVNVWPDALDRAVFGVPGVSEYLAEVTRDDTGAEVLSVALDVADGEPAAGRSAALAAEAIRRVVGLHATVTTVPGGSIAARVEGRFRKRRRLYDRRTED